MRPHRRSISTAWRARLVNPNPVPWQWLPATAGKIEGFGNIGVTAHLAPATHGSQDRYVMALVNRNSAQKATISPQTVFKGDVRGIAFSAGQPVLLEGDEGNITNLRNDTPADVACNENGRCFYVWDEFDNCQRVIFNHFTIRRNDDPGDAADIAIYLKRNPTYLRPGDAGILEPVVATKALRPAQLSQPTAVNAAWNMAVPAGLEGHYQIDLLGRDMLNNERITPYLWRGLVDTLAPRVTFTATATGRVVDNRFEIAYGYRVVDRHLSEEGFRGPCAGQSVLIRGFAEDADMGGLFPELTLRDELRTSCTVFEAGATPAGVVAACDLYQNCVTQSPTVTGVQAAGVQAAALAAPMLSAAVIAPTNQSIVALYPGKGLTVTVAAAAGADSPLREVVILLDGTPVHTLSFSQAEAARSLQHTVNLPLANINLASFQGVHTLTAQATDWAGAVQPTLLPATITVDTEDPVITFDHEGKMTAADTLAFGNSLLRYRGRARDTLGLATVQMRVEGGPWADVTFDETGGWHTVWWMGDEPAGQVYACEVRAIDQAGRVTKVSKALLIDLPVRETVQTTLTAQPERVTKVTEATFAFTGADQQGQPPTRFQCQIDGAPLAACTSPVTYRGLGNGEHVFRVFAMNESGQLDPTPATYTWTVDDGTIPSPSARRLFLPLIARSATVVAGNAPVEAPSDAADIEERAPQPATDAPVMTEVEPMAAEAVPVEAVVEESVVEDVVVEEAPVEQPAVEPSAAEASTTEPVADQPEQGLESAEGTMKQIFLPVALR